MLEAAIKSKCLKVTEQELWSKSIENARSIIHTRDMSDNELVKIATESSSLDSFNTVIKLIYLFTKSNPNGHQALSDLFNSVDNSPYSLGEWISAIFEFSNWLDKNERKSPWPTMLGYLGCCSESPENKDIKHSLKDLLKEMLETYGYEG